MANLLLDGLDSTKQVNLLLLNTSKGAASKQEVSRTVILPLKGSILCSDIVWYN